MYQDLEHLRLLSIFHYVVGGLLALVGCFPFIHVTIGLMLLLAPTAIPDPQAPRELFAFGGAIMAAVGALLIILWWGMAICAILAGRFLSQRRRYMYCLVVAGILCIFVPVGTILGVLAIIVLVRPSVKALFEAAAPPPFAGHV